MPAARIPEVALVTALLASGCAARPGKGVERRESVSFSVTTGDPVAVAATLLARLRALGVRPDAPEIEGGKVTFRVTRAPSGTEREALVSRGHLTFRPVLKTLPAGECTAEAYRQRLAAEHGGPEHDTEPATECAADGDAQYSLGPAQATERDVKDARASDDSTHDWVVTMTMRNAADWASLTERVVGRQLAICLDGVVHSAPTVNERIPDGVAQIGGTFDEAKARALAAVLSSGTLPEGAEVS